MPDLLKDSTILSGIRKRAFYERPIAEKQGLYAYACLSESI